LAKLPGFGGTVGGLQGAVTLVDLRHSLIEPSADRPEVRSVSGAQTEKGFRKDIQGIRGLALVLVLLCHAEVGFAGGGYVGLDIFFVLSGFLITGLLLDELRRTGTISLTRFYARRARRLLPLALTVLAATAIGAQLLFPPVRAGEVAGDVVAAGLFFVNWRFMAEQVDYFAAELDVSPVQHYWSLSVEEQFYVLWPLLVLLGTLWARRSGRDLRPGLWVVVGVIGLPMAVYGLWFTAVDVEQAYFSTLARGWALALGCALALVLPRGLRLPGGLGGLLAGAGLAAILAATVVFESETPYPGWRALVITGATAAFIIAGTAVRPSVPVRILMLEPFQYLGRISYAWYLWHWPVIVFAQALWGPLSTTDLLLVTLAAWIPTTITHHLIEERFRHSRTLARRPRRALAFGAACVATGVTIGVALGQLQPALDEAPASEIRGASVVRGNKTPIQKRVGRIRPAPRNAEKDKGRLHADGCQAKGNREHSPPCVYGVRDSETTVVLLGDSHALQWFPALEKLAHDNRWRLVGLTRGGCMIADVRIGRHCDAWRENTLRRIEREERPALIVTSSATFGGARVRTDAGRLSRGASERPLLAGQKRTLRRLKRTGARIVAIRDQIWIDFTPADCVLEHRRNLDRCAFPRKRPRGRSYDARAARRVRGVTLVDPLRVLCTRRRCPSVIGDALVYRDHYHLSATFARTLAPWLERRLPEID
jgi:peptidoglycan/LPS O-acetylase OafA/YrhL